jgi:signal transduction histidine kinase
MLVVAGGLVLFGAFRAMLTRQFDARLVARAGALTSAIRWDGSKVDLDFTPESMPWYAARDSTEFFELTRLDGTPPVNIAVSPSVEGRSWPGGTAGGTWDSRLPDGRLGRELRITFRPLPDEDLDKPESAALRAAAVASAPTLALRVAMNRSELDRSLAQTRLILGAFGLMMAAGVVGVVRLALARGLRPVERLSVQVQAIGPDSLSSRVEHWALPVELAPIGERLNDMLGRLQAAFDRERRFTAAAAHELRTPVAELRSLLEVTLQNPRNASEYGESLREALGITVQMQQLVSGMLALARHESGRERIAVEPVKLEPLLRRIVQRFQPAAEHRGGRIELACGGELVVRAGPEVLEIILANLLANAVEYAEPAPLVRCEARVDAQAIRVEIRNPVPGLTGAEVATFFETLSRMDAARTARSHLGLGLPLARRLAEAMGATLVARLITPHEIALELSLQREPRS